jgi:hypothetical protein
MRSAKTLVIGILFAAAATGLHAQTQPAPAAGAKPAPAPAASSSPAPQSAKPAAKSAGKKSTKAAKSSGAKPAAKPVEGPADTSAAPPTDAEGKLLRRDPFESLVSRQQAQAKAAANLPPGIAGLQVETLRLDGIVKASNGMIAVVTNQQSRTYFLREGDQLYDGKVEKIAMDGVSFHELGKDAFGKPVERQVNKRIYSSAGEQQ